MSSVCNVPRRVLLAIGVGLAVMLAHHTAAAGQLTLSWVDNSVNEVGFAIERSTGPARGFSKIAVAAADVTSYSDSGLPAGGAYCYRVSAFNGAGGSTYSNEACGVAATFRDVPHAHWAWRYVEALAALGVTVGCTDASYCPDHPVKRAEMAVLLLRAKFGPDYVPGVRGGAEFVDVPAGHWAAAWIEQLAAGEMTAGCGAGRYCPEAPVTRAEMAVFLVRAKYGPAYQPPAPTGMAFADVPAIHWAGPWIEHLVAEGVAAGCTPAGYCPDHPVTRAQMAVFLVRALGLPAPF